MTAEKRICLKTFSQKNEQKTLKSIKIEFREYAFQTEVVRKCVDAIYKYASFKEKILFAG